MINRSTFPHSLFCLAFMAALLFAAPQSHAAMQTFEKEYTYAASELDSKSSCRAIALEQVKRILLQELGVYVESVFNDKASTDGRTPDEVRREITTRYFLRTTTNDHLGNYQGAVEDYRFAARLGSAPAQEFLRKQGLSW